MQRSHRIEMAPIATPLPDAAAVHARSAGFLERLSSSYASILLLALLFSASVYRFALLANGWPGFESDQAIVGLMARHIWLLGEHPLFYYGQFYLGPAQAYAAVPFFALFGASVLTFRLAMIPLCALFLLGLYAVGRLSYGPATAVLSVVWLAIGPSVAVFRELYAAGGRQEILVLASVILLCAGARLRRPERRPHSARAWAICLATYAALGAAIGFGVWSDFLIMPVALATLAALLLARPREVLSWPALVVPLSAVGAAWPFLHFNLTHQWATFTQVGYLADTGAGSLGATLSLLPRATANLLSLVLPTLFGSPRVCVPSSPDLVPYTWVTRVTQPSGLCGASNIAFAGLILAVYGWATWQLLRTVWLRRPAALPMRQTLRPAAALTRHWHAWDTPLAPEAARRSARWWLRAILLASTGMWLIAFVRNPGDLAFPLGSSRYLVPLYLSAPILLGTLWEALSPGLARLSRPGRRHSARKDWRQRLPALGAGAMLVTLLACSLVNGFQMAADSQDATQYALPALPWEARLLTFFATHHVRTYYTDSYYTCYNLAFESNERQVCAVLGPDAQPTPATWLNRYAPYVSAVAADPHHAYLFGASPGEESAFLHGDLPGKGYRRAVIDGYAIYYAYAP
jgi:hypothetical protein